MSSALGFLSVIEDTEHGLFGGYLLLNLSGRPLEFHCTTPIKPNRAQRILYGPTLEPFLFGEQIGRTLFRKASAIPRVVCTDAAAALALREHVEVPVVLVLPTRGTELVGREEPALCAEDEDAAAGGTDRSYRVDSSHCPRPPLCEFAWRGKCLAVGVRAAAEQARILERLDAIDDLVDLAEPFERIRQAIDEARNGGG